MATTRAKIETKNAALSGEFGLDWATKLFGEDAINSLPVYQRGKNKGKIKGYVIWQKVISGGWLGGFVYPGQIARAWIGASADTTPESALRGTWLGRVQGLSGPTDYLFEKGRARHAQEVEAHAARDAENSVAEEAFKLGQQAAREGVTKNPFILNMDVVVPAHWQAVIDAWQFGYDEVVSAK